MNLFRRPRQERSDETVKALQAVKRIAEALYEIAVEVHDKLAKMCRMLGAYSDNFPHGYNVYRIVLVVLGVLGVLGALGALVALR